MNCKFCNKQLSESQVYELIKGKSKGFCSSKCAAISYVYKTKENYILKNKRNCKTCNKEFYAQPYLSRMYCNPKCAGKSSSIRMKENNPMRDDSVRKKVSNTLKKIGHKPKVLGGNGRGPSVYQKQLYDELVKINDSFKMEFIFKTKLFNKDKIYPNHYKIDIALFSHKIAIEVDGSSHNSKKVKICDKKKSDLLISQGWKVLRLSNYQIETELKNCVQMVSSMI
jgi:hypothetical protein